ncbi:MAG: hypothetical protein ABI164_01070 [Acidobacteriaceae bacterium]
MAQRIKKISGDVVIDDRLFQPNHFRDQFYISPIFVNDDAVDLTINPTAPGNPASVVSRPVSAATVGCQYARYRRAGLEQYSQARSGIPRCIGQPGCTVSPSRAGVKANSAATAGAKANCTI